MRFENQVSLYDTDAIINKFTTQDTKINVVQGEIDLIISESERRACQRRVHHVFAACQC